SYEPERRGALRSKLCCKITLFFRLNAGVITCSRPVESGRRLCLLTVAADRHRVLTELTVNHRANAGITVCGVETVLQAEGIGKNQTQEKDEDVSALRTDADGEPRNRSSVKSGLRSFCRVLQIQNVHVGQRATTFKSLHE